MVSNLGPRKESAMKPFADLSDQRVVKGPRAPAAGSDPQPARTADGEPERALGRAACPARERQLPRPPASVVRADPARAHHAAEGVDRAPLRARRAPRHHRPGVGRAARHRQARHGGGGARAARPARERRRDGGRVHPARGASQPHGDDARRRGLAPRLGPARRHVREARDDRARQRSSASRTASPSRRTRRSCSCTSSRRRSRTTMPAPSTTTGAISNSVPAAY